MENQDIADQQETSENLNLVRASLLKRIGNALIDLIATYLIMLIIQTLSGNLFSGSDDSYGYQGGSYSDEGYDLSSILFSYLIYLLYIGLSEAGMRGRTFGKMVTGTRAVNTDGSDIDALTAFARGLLRLIPFEFISYLDTPCNPWHDRWTQTMVIDEHLSDYEDGTPDTES